MTMNKEQLLVEIQSNFRKNIRGSGLIYMSLYELIETEQAITPESISRAIYMPLRWVKQYDYIYSEYMKVYNVI